VFTISTKNIGHTPATNVTTSANALVDKVNTQNSKLPAFVKEAFQFAAARAGLDNSGETLFPDEKFEPQWRITLNKPDIDAAVSKFNGRDAISVYLVVTVNYRFGSGKGQTARIVDVMARNPQTGSLQLIDPNSDVPPAGPWGLNNLPVGEQTF